MITDLKPYPAMRASGVEWLGEVPEHWEVAKLRSILRSTTSRNRPDLPLLSVVREKGVIVRDVSNQESNHNFIPDDLSNYKVVREGQFAMNKMKAWQGSYGVSKHEGIVSPAYFVFDLNGVSEDFFNRAIRSKAYVPSFTQASDGVRIGQWDLAQDRMREIGFSTPPLPEQAAIVRYLDHVDRRVRRLTRAKRKLIALLTEQKQAIIHRAVTRGLDPDVPLKDSGVEWLGEVPEHWEVRRLRSLARVKTGGRDTQDRIDDGDFPFFVRSQTAERINSWSYDGEAVLTAGDGAGVAKVFHYVNGKFDYHQRVYKFSHFKDVLGKFFFEYFRATLKFEALAGNAKSTVDSLRQPMLLSFPCLLPPTTEQAAIVDYLDQATADIDTTIARAECEINLLNEYRTRLIADVVTGKLDVRDAAAALPEVDPLAEDENADDLDADPDLDTEELDEAPGEAEA